MRSFRFEVINNTIHILDGPPADQVLELPDDRVVKRLKDMLLHWNDLMEAKLCLESFNSKNTDIVIVGANPGSKYQDALNLGITIWDETRTLEVLNNLQ